LAAVVAAALMAAVVVELVASNKVALILPLEQRTQLLLAVAGQEVVVVMLLELLAVIRFLGQLHRLAVAVAVPVTVAAAGHLEVQVAAVVVLVAALITLLGLERLPKVIMELLGRHQILEQTLLVAVVEVLQDAVLRHHHSMAALVDLEYLQQLVDHL